MTDTTTTNNVIMAIVAVIAIVFVAYVAALIVRAQQPADGDDGMLKTDVNIPLQSSRQSVDY
jgi:hypothetical protein